MNPHSDQAARRTRTGFVNNWVDGGEGGSRSLRRRVMAILRIAYRMLGIRRKGLGLGALGLRGARLAGLSLVAGLSFAAPVSAKVFVNNTGNSNDTSCAWIEDAGTMASSFTTTDAGGGNQSGCSAADASTQTNRSLFYAGATFQQEVNLTLGGLLFVNAGKIGVTDVATGTYSMRMGSVATMNAAAGANSIAIGSAQTSTSDGASSGATVASGNDAIAIGVTAKASGLNSIALGSAAAASAQGSSALGSSASASGIGSTALGRGAAAAADSAVAVGDGASAQTASAVAIGASATALGGKAVSIGAGNTANGNGAVAIGDPNSATGTGAIAMGANNTSNGQGAVALGNANTATGQGSVALGNSSTSAGAGAVSLGDTAAANSTKGVALGSGATATNQNDVALGASSVTASPNATSGTTIAGKFYSFAGTSPTSVVSVGASGSERQITNVAAGRISSSSTDAINGSQLYATNQAVTAVQQVANAGWNVTTSSTGTGTVSGTTVQNIAPGATATFTAGNNIAVTQNGAEVQIATSMTPTFTSVTTGNTTMNSSGLTITGGPSVTSTGINAGGTKITNVAAGTNPTDAVNLSQMTTAVTGVQTHYYSVNDGGTQQANYTNNGATGTNSMAAGVAASALGTGSTALGLGATANNAGDVALGSNSVTAAANPTASTVINGTTYNFAGTTPTSVVSVGGVGTERQITNVAAGRISATSTDAINGSELYATNQAVTAVQQVANSGWNVTTKATGTGTATGTTVQNIAPGATATFTAGNNIAVTQNGAEVQIATSMTPSFTSVTTGNTTMNSSGLTITGGPSITSTGIDAAGNKITNVAAGTNPTDAVNLSQMTTAVTGVQTHYYSVNDAGTPGGNYNNNGATGFDALAAGIGASAAGSWSIAVGTLATAPQLQGIAIGVQAQAAVGDGVAIGAHASATANFADVALGARSATSPQVVTTGTTINGVAYTYAGTNIQGTVSIGQPGLQRTLTNLGAGRVSATSTDGINGSQLYATNQAITAVGDRAVKYDLNPDGTVNYGSSTLQGPVSTDGGVTGGTKITNLAQGAVTSTSTDAINGAQLYSVQQLAGAGWNVTTAATGTGTVSGTTVHNIAPGATATFTAGNNIAVTQNGAEVQIATSMTPTFTSVTTGNTTMTTNGLTIAGGPSITSTGIDAAGTKITNLAPGTAGTDAVNLSQLTTAVTGVKTHYYSVNDGGTASGNFNNDGATGTNALAAGVNAVATGTGSTAIGFGATANNANDVALGSGSVTAAANPTASTVINGTTYTFAGMSPTSVVSVGGVGTERQITNVAAGRISATSTDAINGSQLYATNQAIDTLSQGSVKYDTSGGTVNYNSITLAGPGGTKITNVAPGAVTSTSTDAVNGSQLYSVQQLAGAGWNVTTKATGTGKVTGTTVQNVAPGSTATFTAGDNIEITQVGSEIQIATSKTPSFTSVTTGNTKIDSNGLTIVGGPSVTSTGIDAGGSRITNVAAGIAPTDAANMSQVNNAVNAAKTHYYGVNDNGVIQANYTNDGATGVNSMAAGVAAVASGAGSTAIGFGATAKNAGDVALGQGSTTAAAVATTSTTIGGKTYTFAGTSPTSTVSVGSVGAERTVTNVAAGRLGSTSTDAINGSQLYATNQAVNVLYNGGAGPVQYSNSSTPTTPNGGTPTNDLTLVGGSTGPVVLHNVGDGAVSSTSTDAVNGKQLYNMQANVPGSWQSPTSNTYVLSNPAGGGGAVTLSNVAPGALSPTSNQAVNGAQLYATNQAINNIATGFGNLQSQIDSNARRADAGIATAAALGMIRYDDRPGKLSTGAAVTYHHSQAGLAMGAGYTTEDRLWRVSAGLAFSPTNGSAADVTAGASATYTWN